MALIQIDRGVVEHPDLSFEETMADYDSKVAQTKQLMMDKNHDYGEAWRDMRVSSLTDLILQKLLRVKQIEDNAGKTLVEISSFPVKLSLNFLLFSSTLLPNQLRSNSSP